MRCKKITNRKRAALRQTAALLHATALVAATAFLVLPEAAGAAVIEGDSAMFQWLPASGPVAGYNVFVTRNGASSGVPELVVASNSATVSGAVGDTIVVQIAAFDADGSEGPLSPASEDVLFAAVAPPGPPNVTVDIAGDFSLDAVLAMAAPGEQVIGNVVAPGRHLLDTAPPEDHDPSDVWGLDQLVVGSANVSSTARLVDAVGLAELAAPLVDQPTVTLFGLGNGPPCERDGDVGLVIHAGSELVLGGADLYAFDGQDCIHVNALFDVSPDPNRIQWGDGEVVLHGDLEEDGVLDPDDNCLLVSNFDQCDIDRDGFGNRCDQDVDGDMVMSASDMDAIMQATSASSHDPTLDVNCDGAVGLDDLADVMDHFLEVVGPSGLACAADASCTFP